ncbi:EamA family transporter RarD [Paracoccus sp. (in: a-proteobacteria)]|uniref:EamA family transporter RarD n=1 Tax=Paracoccus sp. TaxID=267 RepID=UPI0026DFA246|nr:EamA family transporter RarD [Paracoccus sp. (in: a-proteobacteria)]MDO5371277.1 EamA family transporter RarD [Paracoccus sp. (in: a-proteobacteria)]
MSPHDSPRGLAFGIGAYLIWGVIPLYLHEIAHVPPAEVIAHRILWSLPVALLVLRHNGQLGTVVTTLRQPRLVMMAAVTASLITLNWLVYVWAVMNDQAIEAALGYYINPLFSIFLGWALLGERLSRPQLAAISLAVLAVLLLTLSAGGLPVVALTLTLTWGLYAYCKRSLPLPANEGFTVEILLLFVPSAVYVSWLLVTGTGHFGRNLHDTLLLAGTGLITAVPLMLYANGAKLLRLSTMGFLQYLAPTMVFLTAVLIFHEPFEGVRLIAFPMIWIALVLYTATLLPRRA